MSCRRAATSGTLGATLLALSLCAGSLDAESFHFARLNRTYTDFLEGLRPVELGNARIDLAMPEHSLTLESHAVELTADPRGGHKIELELRFGGHGLIEAQVTLGKIESHISDELGVPIQSLLLVGRIEIDRSEGGYTITTIEVPEHARVRIESKLARQLFSLCRQMALVLVSMDCVELERSLTWLEVPLPAPGSSYFLPDRELTEPERLRLDDYLTRSRSARLASEH